MSQAKTVEITDLTKTREPFISDPVQMNGVTVQIKFNRPIVKTKKVNFHLIVSNAKRKDNQPLTARQIINIHRMGNLPPINYDKIGDIAIDAQGKGTRPIQMSEKISEIMSKGCIANDKMTVTFEIIPTIKECSPIVGTVHKPSPPQYFVIPASQRRNYYVKQEPPYDSKKETGFVGIKNQGATCYMNSILQTLYNIPRFRRMIYMFRTNSSTLLERQKDIVLNLQILFYKLQTSPVEISTMSLIKSFGWDQQDAFIQHDSTEFWTVLMSTLSEKIAQNAQTVSEFNKLFDVTTHIMATPVGSSNSFQLGRKEISRILPLRIEGVSSLDDAVALMSMPSVMDDPIQCPDGTRSIVNLTTIIDHLPTVLAIQLMRFSIDNSGQRFKLNSKVEYSQNLTIHTLEQGFVNYSLHGVVCHTGSAMGGHYYAYLRPSVENKWYCFNDTKVTVAKTEEVFDNNFSNSAYILLYVMTNEEANVYSPIPLSDIPEQVSTLTSEEGLISEITVISDSAITLNSTLGITGFRNSEVEKDLVINKKKPVTELYSLVAGEFNIPAGSFSLWVCNDQGKPLTMIPQRDNESILICSILDTSKLIFLDTSISSIDSDYGNVFIAFIKIFKPSEMTCTYFGSTHVISDATIGELGESVVPELSPFAAFIEKGQTAERLDLSSRINDVNIGSGSVIVFQKDDHTRLHFGEGPINYLSIAAEENDGLYPTFLSLQSYIEVKFVALNSLNEPLQIMKCPKEIPTESLFQIVSNLTGIPKENLSIFSVMKEGYTFKEFSRTKETAQFLKQDCVTYFNHGSDITSSQGFNIPLEICESNFNISQRLILHVLPNQTIQEVLTQNGITIPPTARILDFNFNKVSTELSLDNIVLDSFVIIRIIYRPLQMPYIDVSVDDDKNLNRPPLFFSVPITETTNYEQLKELIKRTLSVENAIFNRYRCHFITSSVQNQTGIVTDSTLVLPLITGENLTTRPYVHVSTVSSGTREVSVRIYN